MLIKNKNYYFLKLKKYTEFTILSFVLFYLVLRGISMNLYLGIYAAVIFILYLAAGSYKNTEILLEFLSIGSFFTLGFLISKITIGRTLEGIWNNWSEVRFFLFEFIILEYIIFWIFQIEEQKELQIEQIQNYQNLQIQELFSTREDDLERLSFYLSEVDAVGINGSWGSGKTFLIDQFIERNCKQYDIIKVEPLTCKMSTIDSYLFQQLEKVLLANRIYPRYSRKLRNTLFENAWGKQLYTFMNISENDQLTEFQGFCQDLDKLDHKILLVYEDIDRLSVENRDQISHLFDLTQKMLPHNVKVIYQFDLEKMAALDFNRDYLEKYVPYIVNLTEIPVKKLVIKGLKELDYVNVGLTWNDFRFLFETPIEDYFLGKEFNIPLYFKFEAQNITARKIKAFLTEVNTIMHQTEFFNKECRKTVIAFFFMKHIFSDLYQQLSFKRSLLEEVNFIYRNHESDKVEKITILEVIARLHLKDDRKLETEAIKDMFFKTEDNENAEENLDKLALLLLLGYKVEFIQKRADQEDEKNCENALNQELKSIKNKEYNDKISRLILCLYQNGKSEYTNAEAVAMTFIKDVLLKEESQWETSWKEFQTKISQSDFFKDNKTIFSWEIDKFSSLFRALWVYFSKHYSQYRETIMDKALEFYKKFDDVPNRLSLEKIAIFNTFEFEKREYYLKVITWFNELEVAGHFYEDDIYREFLDKYTMATYKQGYLKTYSLDYLYIPSAQGEEKKIHIEKFLRECRENVLHPELPQFSEKIKKESKLVVDFYDKNLQLLQEEKPAVRKKIQREFKWVSRKRHTDEMIFKKMEQEITNRNFHNVQEKREIQCELEEYYAKEKINLREYFELWDKTN